jgi:hypothetical protein
MIGGDNKPTRKYGTIVPQNLKPATWGRAEPITFQRPVVCSTSACTSHANYRLVAKNHGARRARVLYFCLHCIDKLQEPLRPL